MISYSAAALVLVTCTLTLFANPLISAAPPKAQITVLYDAFGKTPGMQKDWGYSALIECAGKRILFDTGNNPEILEQNAKAKGADLLKARFCRHVAPAWGPHGRIALFVEGEPHC